MKVVVYETGLKPDTLRAWERRYGVPNPERTPGGHRLYSQHEIDLLKWLVARQDEGMSISHAVELWQQLEREGQNPLLTGDTAVSEPTIPHITGEQVDELRQAWIEACLAFNEYQAQHLLARAFALFSIETVCHQVLQQGLSEIGEGWYEGTVSVQQEHFASALALRQLEALLVAMPVPTRNGRVLVACPPTELHTFAPLMISLMLRRQGWDVVYLGANVPLDRLETSVEQIKPQLVILSAQTLTAAGHMLPLAQKLAEMDVPLAFGGAVFNQIEQTVEAIPGHFLTKTLEQIPQTVEKLMQTRPAFGKVKKPGEAYQGAYEHFIERRSAIDAHLHTSPMLLEVPTALLSNTNNEFSDDIEAALLLGDLTMVNSNLDWVKGLLLNNHSRLTHTTLQHYLQQYHEAVKNVMDQRAVPLLDWFDQLD
jgi:methanogenic corrinoid protein MtbC1